MAYQKGLNSNRNHHDSLSHSGKNRIRNDNHSSGVLDVAGKMMSDAFKDFGSKPKRPNNYGQGKHSNGGKPKQNHW